MKLKDYISRDIIKSKSLIQLSYPHEGREKKVVTTLADAEYRYFLRDCLMNREVLEINFDTHSIKLGELEKEK